MRPFTLNEEEIAHVKLLRKLTVPEYQMTLDMVQDLARSQTIDQHANSGINVFPIVKPAG